MRPCHLTHHPSDGPPSPKGEGLHGSPLALLPSPLGRGDREAVGEARPLLKTMKHNSKLTPYARQLRKNMTKEECELWYKYLRQYPYQFRRQVTVGIYILDFYCAAAKLAVELDGSQHYTEEGKQHDTVRTRFLESLGIRVVRYPNSIVMKNLQGVCADIDRIVQERVEKLSHP